MGLVLGLALMAAAVVVLHRTSAASDTVWAVLAHSRTQGLETDAYFYTEVGAVRSFLDERGRYGSPLTGAPPSPDPAGCSGPRTGP